MVGSPEREARIDLACVVDEFGAIDLRLIERRICHHKIEAANQLMGIIVIAVGASAQAPSRT
jgi:hypothetical protein